MEFAPMNVANSAEMIHAIKNFAASFSGNIRNSILDNGTFSKPIFFFRKSRSTTNANIRQEKLKQNIELIGRYHYWQYWISSREGYYGVRERLFEWGAFKSLKYFVFKNLAYKQMNDSQRPKSEV